MLAALNKIIEQEKPFFPGGEGSKGYDCVGFIRAVYRAYGVNLPPRDPVAVAEKHNPVNWLLLNGFIKSEVTPYSVILSYYQGAPHFGIMVSNSRAIHYHPHFKYAVYVDVPSAYFRRPEFFKYE